MAMDAAMRTVVRFCFLGALLCVATWIEGVQTQSGEKKRSCNLVT